MPDRKRGGQPGNENAVKHGRYSRRRKAERQAKAVEQAEQHRKWMRTVPKIDYATICATIEASAARKH